MGGQLASAPGPPLHLRAADSAGGRWHAPSHLYPVCPRLEAEPREAAKDTGRGIGEGQNKSRESHSQGCGATKDSTQTANLPATQRSPVDGRKPGKDMERDLEGGAAAPTNRGAGTWACNWSPPERWASPSEGTSKDFEVGGAAERTQRLNTTATQKMERNRSEKQPESLRTIETWSDLGMRELKRQREKNPDWRVMGGKLEAEESKLHQELKGKVNQ